MKKNSTPAPILRHKRNHPAQRQHTACEPKAGTIETIRQFARCVYADSRIPCCHIVLN